MLETAIIHLKFIFIVATATEKVSRIRSNIINIPRRLSAYNP